MTLKAKRLKRLRVHEVSGVDAPAHLAPGHLVMKAVDPLADLSDEQVEAITKAFVAEEEEPPMNGTIATPGTLARKAAALGGRALSAEETERCTAIEKAVETSQAERGRWSSLTAGAVDRIIKDWLDPVTRMNKALDEIQKADPTVNRAAAFLQAAEADPELLAAYDERVNTPAELVEKAEVDPAWSALEALADEIQGNGVPDRATAIIKAADLRPDLARAVSGG